MRTNWLCVPLICLLHIATSTLVTDESEVENYPVETKVSEVRRARSVLMEGNETRIITTILLEPYLMLKDDADNREGNDRYKGFVADFTEQIVKIAGFKYELRLVADSSYGSVNSDGKWNGMIGELINGQADMAIAPLTVTWEREKVVDFSNPIIPTGISIMIKKPEILESDNIFAFLNPFSTDIWLYTAVGYIGVSIVLFLISRFSPYERQDNVDDASKPTPSDITEPGTSTTLPKGTRNKCYTERLKVIHSDFSNAFWFSWGAFTHQDAGFRPRSISGRIAGLVWWIFVFVIVSCYIANWAALLLTPDTGYPRIKLPVESAEDLAKQAEIKYGTLRNGSTSHFFKTSKVELYQRMWSVMQSDPSVYVDSVEDGIERVRQSRGKYAFLLESSQNDYANMQRPCNTMKVGENLMSTFYAIATPKGSALRHLVDFAALILLESGDIDMLQRKWWVQKGDCPLARKREGFYAWPLTLPKLLGLFYILCFGLVLALVVCICEFLISRFFGKLCTRKQNVSQAERSEQIPLAAPGSRT